MGHGHRLLFGRGRKPDEGFGWLLGGRVQRDLRVHAQGALPTRTHRRYVPGHVQQRRHVLGAARDSRPTMALQTPWKPQELRMAALRGEWLHHQEYVVKNCNFLLFCRRCLADSCSSLPASLSLCLPFFGPVPFSFFLCLCIAIHAVPPVTTRGIGACWRRAEER